MPREERVELPPVTFSARVTRETAKAVLCLLAGPDNREVWIPKSVLEEQVAVDRDEVVDVSVAGWFAAKEGLE
jgi:hypothetical protein